MGLLSGRSVPPIGESRDGHPRAHLLECERFVSDPETIPATAMTISRDMLATFLQVVDGLSVSHAADELGVGKSVVSKRVAQLEDALGATLFARSTRRIVLTPAGEVYAAHARRALAELRAGEEEVRALRSEMSGRIRLTAPVSWGQRVLAKRLPCFLKEYPGIEIDLQLADRIMDLAFERIDIALRWSTAPAPEFVCTPVASIDWVLAATPAYLLDAGMPAAPQDLRHHTCLAYWRESSDEAWQLARAGSPDEQVQVRVSSRYHVDNPEAVVDAALAGLGIAMMPSYLCQDALDDGRLRPVLPDWVPRTKFGTLITALTTPDRLRLGRNRALLGYLRQDLQRDPAQSQRASASLGT